MYSKNGSSHIIHEVISTSGNGGHLELMMFEYNSVSLHLIVPY